MNDNFEEQAQRLFQQKTSMLADEILSFWRVYEPQRIDTLFSHGALRKTIKVYERTLLDMQRYLEDMEQLPPPLAKMEAWRNLMRIEEEEDEADKEADWGPWREEYRTNMDANF
jgi:hypothetical protein